MGMQAKHLATIYLEVISDFIVECIDITGWLGGYNFQWAWASGYVIVQNL